MQRTGDGRPQAVVIGLDCVPPHLLFEQWRSELPHLNALMARGLWGPMRSCHPPITVPAWASMLSGKDPGQLGLYGFRNRRAYTYDEYALANSTFVKHDRVWDILSRHGKRVTLLGVPQTFPPQPLNGYLVSCFLTPSKSVYTYPADLQREIEGVAGGYVFDVGDFRTPDKRALLHRIHEKTRKHFQVARYLVSTKPWDFFMMVEMGPDRMHHAFWNHSDPRDRRYEPGNEFEHAIHDYYVYLDREVGELLALVDPDALVVVVSDHGAKRMDGGICINEWLMQQGHLTLHEYPKMMTPLTPAMIDWSRTRAWGDGGYCGRVFFNVKGREPRGTVAAADYESLRDALMAGIAAIRSPTGQPLGSRAYRPETLYRETTGIPPDLIVYFGDLSWRSISSVGGHSLYALDNDSGPDGANHDWDGICIIRNGPDDTRSRRLEGLQIMDVAPTILRHFNIAIPGAMQGTVIDASRSADDLSLTARPVPPAATAGGSVA